MSGKLVLKSKESTYDTPVVSVGEYVYDIVSKLQDKPFIVECKTGSELTSKQLINNSQSLAVSLLNQGIEKSDIIMAFSRNSFQYAITQFAVFFLGNTFNSMEWKSTRFQLKNQIRDSGTTVIFTSLLNANNVRQVLNDMNNEDIRNQIKFVVVFDGSFDNYLSFDRLLSEGKDKRLERIPFFEVNPKADICAIVYTSGTTGLPKGVMITHHTFVHILMYEMRSDIPWTCVISFNFRFGFVPGIYFLPIYLFLGNKVIIYDELDEEIILKSVEKYKINGLTIYSGIYYRLMEGDLKDKYDISSLKFMISGGIKFSIEAVKRLEEKFGIIYRELYGMSEYHRPVMPNGPLGSVGSVGPNTELKIIDLSTGESLGPNTEGEICLRGGQLFKGYLNNESATKAAIDSDGWFRTGDVGHYDRNQYIYITDRLKDSIEFRDARVYPAEVEGFLQKHESVECAAVIGVKHKFLTEIPRAYIKLRTGYEITEQELLNYVKENMASHQQLRGGIVFVDEIPKTKTGKVDKKDFKNLAANELLG